MKKLAATFLLFLFAFALSAQETPIFTKDDKYINVGLGLGSYGLFSGVGVISADYCIADGIADVGSIGIGPYLGFGVYNRYSWGYGTTAYSSIIKAGARATFHYPLVKELDTYAGLGVGLSFNTYHRHFRPNPGLFIGARYLFSDNLALYGELGHGVSNMVIGVSFDF